MKWISVKDKLPIEYKQYLVCHLAECEACGTKEKHLHSLSFVRVTFAIASWCKPDMTLVTWYRNKGNHDWDWAADPYWRSSQMVANAITHWMEFDNNPENTAAYVED